ncbi:hypothetical protein EJB05_12291, partial [Eragrostis curvula]
MTAALCVLAPQPQLQPAEQGQYLFCWLIPQHRLNAVSVSISIPSVERRATIETGLANVTTPPPTAALSAEYKPRRGRHCRNR